MEKSSSKNQSMLKSIFKKEIGVSYQVAFHLLF
ncbi:hypothetical protein CcarbDRAFT_3102 [Clostridium carboxidivorans P7]|uniref:Uncharacterized protein n=1 Tax=Clostridium carboxidivorans P7 TaxID=536227 RepID=C6PWD5_9CLOT|nr:hypothetical protein CcarbDRAFT_3102 [Clostridium carboxidivorans P7]